MTSDQARALLKAIDRDSGNPGYVAKLSEIEIEGWLTLFKAMGLISDQEA